MAPGVSRGEADGGSAGGGQGRQHCARGAAPLRAGLPVAVPAQGYVNSPPIPLMVMMMTQTLMIPMERIPMSFSTALLYSGG